MRTDLVPTDRGAFGVRRAGPPDAPLVLCVHGFPDDASTWDGLAPALVAEGYQAAAVYLRGYSPSPLTGSLALDDLVQDLVAVRDALAPDRPAYLVGHDYGAQLGYALLARHGSRFAAAALLAGAHPTAIARNTRRYPRQLWLSRYIVFFQLGRLADAAFARNDFAAVDRLWRRWSPGFRGSAAHLAEVKNTLRRSMPAPVAMYRAGGFGIGAGPIAVPTLYVSGGDDGCALPGLADGQDQLFTAAYRALIWPGVGHFPHLERPEATAAEIVGWFAGRAGG